MVQRLNAEDIEGIDGLDEKLKPPTV